MLNNRMIVAAVVGGMGLVAPAMALVAPYTETFSSAAANWSSGSVFTPLDYVGSGGPDGSGYGSRAVSFANNTIADTPLLFRCQSNFGSSGNAFFGNWITGGVTEFTFSVRHNAPVAIDFFGRFATGATPGGVALTSSAVQPNTWTTFTVPITNSSFIYEGPGVDFSIFNNINRIQVGVLMNNDIVGAAGPFSFDIDNVRITPAPGTALALCGVGAVGLRRRRR